MSEKSVATSSPEKPVTPERIMQIAWGFTAPLLIESAVRYGIFDAIDANGPQSVEQIAQRAAASPRAIRIILNALVGLQFLSRDPQNRYALTPESAAFLVSKKPGFQGGIFKHISSQLIPGWLHLNDIVRDGKPHREVNQHGTGSAFFEKFVEDIFPMSYPAAQLLARTIGEDGKRAMKVLDLAAGSGVWGIALAQPNPKTTVTAVDWKEVLEVTKRIAARFEVAKQFNYIAGDINTIDFGRGYDLATLGHILHSEGEARGKTLIRKTFDALAPGGTIAIAEFLVNDARTGPPMGLIFAVNMLVNTDEGDTFSFGEISRWLREAGFEDLRTLDAPGPSPLILATKPK
jgi:ubiquinone/menaquinone biosynthesis C-methylase UbiE